jgi:hypothetical protein
VTEFFVDPLVPVIVRVEVATGVVLLVTTVSVEVTVVVDEVGETLAGLNVPVAPDGKPLTPRATALVKPPVPVTLTV